VGQRRLGDVEVERSTAPLRRARSQVCTIRSRCGSLRACSTSASCSSSHTREDEYSYVLEGRVGALVGETVVVGNPGDVIFKPRDQWHTFWNAGEEPVRLLEIISPAGLERFFAELVDLGGVTQVDSQTMLDLCAWYELEIDFDSVPGLIERFELRLPGEAV